MKWLHKKNMRTYAVTCSAVVLAVIGSTMAYFTSSDEASNRFSAEVQRLDIVLTEPNWSASNGVQVVPGDVLPKDPKITNNEKTPAYVFLRVTVPCDSPEIEYDKKDGDKDKGDLKSSANETTQIPMYKFGVKNEGIAPVTYTYDNTDSIGQQVNSAWQLVGGTPTYHEGSSGNKKLVYVYAYVDNGNKLQVLNYNETTPTLFDAVKICNFNEKMTGGENSHHIKVEAFGIQTDHLGTDDHTPEKVWSLLASGG